MSFQATSDSFVEWLQKSGVHISPSASIADLRSDNQGRGLVATADIAENEVLFLIPRDCVLSLNNCSFKNDYPDRHLELYQLGQWEALMVVLAYEMYKADSKWKPYFDVLPTRDESEFTSNQLIFWSSSELEELKPSLVLDRVGMESTNKLFHDLFEVKVLSWKVLEFSGFTREDFYKVGALIMSYSFDVDEEESIEDDDNEVEEHEDVEDVNDEEEQHDESDDEHSDSNDEDGTAEGEDDLENENDNDLMPSSVSDDTYLKSMVPLADTLNADTHLHNASLSYQGNLLVMKATKPIKTGNQIYNTYSNHPNSEILRRYGYVEYDGSAYDFGEIPFTTIKDYFSRQFKAKPQFENILEVLSTIHDNEQQDDEPTELIVESYDCYSNQEVLMELTFLVQLLTILVAINKVTPFRKMSKSEVYSGIKRLYHKCYQLIESQKLTKDYIKNYKAILEKRISQYPEEVKGDFKVEKSTARKILAKHVLRSEVQSLIKCLDTSIVYKDFMIVDDGKLIRNINKRSSEQKDGGVTKRAKV